MQGLGGGRPGGGQWQATYSEVILKQWRIVSPPCANTTAPAAVAREAPQARTNSKHFWSVLLLLSGVAAALSFGPDLPRNRAGAKPPLLAITAAQSAAPPPQTVWTTELRPQRRVVLHPTWKVRHEQRTVQTLRPVWVTLQREEPYTVSKPVLETSVQYEKVQVNRPVTTYTTRHVDRGAWVTEQVTVPGKASKQLKWVPGGWATHASTGLVYWRLGMLRPVEVVGPPTTTTRQVWKPNVVAVQLPETKLVTETQSKPIYTQNVRYIQEQRVRKVPVRVCQFVPHDVVRTMPVVTCEMTPQEVVEQVPVRVCRQIDRTGAAPHEPGVGEQAAPLVPVTKPASGGTPDLVEPHSDGPRAEEPDSGEPLDASRVAYATAEKKL